MFEPLLELMTEILQDNPIATVTESLSKAVKARVREVILVEKNGPTPLDPEIENEKRASIGITIQRVHAKWEKMKQEHPDKATLAFHAELKALFDGLDDILHLVLEEHFFEAIHKDLAHKISTKFVVSKDIPADPLASDLIHPDNSDDIKDLHHGATDFHKNDIKPGMEKNPVAQLHSAMREYAALACAEAARLEASLLPQGSAESEALLKIAKEEYDPKYRPLTAAQEAPKSASIGVVGRLKGFLSGIIPKTTK